MKPKRFPSHNSSIMCMTRSTTSSNNIDERITKIEALLEKLISNSNCNSHNKFNNNNRNSNCKSNFLQVNQRFCLGCKNILTCQMQEHIQYPLVQNLYRLITWKRFCLKEIMQRMFIQCLVKMIILKHLLQFLRTLNSLMANKMNYQFYQQLMHRYLQLLLLVLNVMITKFLYWKVLNTLVQGHIDMVFFRKLRLKNV